MTTNCGIIDRQAISPVLEVLALTARVLAKDLISMAGVDVLQHSHGLLDLGLTEIKLRLLESIGVEPGVMAKRTQCQHMCVDGKA